MRLSYHLLITSQAATQLSQWQNCCQAEGFALRFVEDISKQGFSRIPTLLRLDYRGRMAEVSVYTSPASDVSDICDELPQYLSEDQNLALNFDFDGEQENIYGVTVAVLLLTKLLDGLLYMEGDGLIVTAAEALENAKAIDNELSPPN